MMRKTTMGCSWPLQSSRDLWLLLLCSPSPSSSTSTCSPRMDYDGDDGCRDRRLQLLDTPRLLTCSQRLRLSLGDDDDERKSHRWCCCHQRCCCCLNRRVRSMTNEACSSRLSCPMMSLVIFVNL